MLRIIRRKAQAWRTLSPWERAALRGMAWRLLKVWVLLRVRSDALAVSLRTKPSLGVVSASAVGSHREFAWRCAQLMQIAAGHGLYHANCLHRALALRDFLQASGVDARIKIGILPEISPFQAHAWVEFEGVALGESVAHYREMPLELALRSAPTFPDA